MVPMISPAEVNSSSTGLSKPPPGDPFEAGSIGTDTPDSGPESFIVAAVLRVDVEAVSAVSQIQPPVGTVQERSVETSPRLPTCSSR